MGAFGVEPPPPSSLHAEPHPCLIELIIFCCSLHTPSPNLPAPKVVSAFLSFSFLSFYTYVRHLKIFSFQGRIIKYDSVFSWFWCPLCESFHTSSYDSTKHKLWLLKLKFYLVCCHSTTVPGHLWFLLWSQFLCPIGRSVLPHFIVCAGKWKKHTCGCFTWNLTSFSYL